MEGVNFLNLEYLFLRVYRVMTGFEFDAGRVPEFAMSLWTSITVLGLALALVFLVALVWVYIRFVVVEHEYKYHEAIRTHRAGILSSAQSGSNPRWARVEKLTSSSQESDWRHAVMEADAMLGEVLTERGFLGESVGDQLRGANPLQFTTLDLAWRAHKVRNDIAHQSDFHLTARDARTTIDLYRRVFEEFGVI